MAAFSYHQPHAGAVEEVTSPNRIELRRPSFSAKNASGRSTSADREHDLSDVIEIEPQASLT